MKEQSGAEYLRSIAGMFDSGYSDKITPTQMVIQVTRIGQNELMYVKRYLIDAYLSSGADFGDEEVKEVMEATNFDELAKVFEPYFGDPTHASCLTLVALICTLYDFDVGSF